MDSHKSACLEPFVDNLKVTVEELKDNDVNAEVDNAANVAITVLDPDLVQYNGVRHVRLCSPTGTCPTGTPVDVGNYWFHYTLLHSLDP